MFEKLENIPFLPKAEVTIPNELAKTLLTAFIEAFITPYESKTGALMHWTTPLTSLLVSTSIAVIATGVVIPAALFAAGALAFGALAGLTGATTHRDYSYNAFLISLAISGIAALVAVASAIAAILLPVASSASVFTKSLSTCVVAFIGLFGKCKSSSKQGRVTFRDENHISGFDEVDLFKDAEREIEEQKVEGTRGEEFQNNAPQDNVSQNDTPPDNTGTSANQIV